MKRTINALATAAAALALVTSCSSSDQPATSAEPSTAPAETTTAQTTTDTPTPAENDSIYGVTPNGLTTSVNVPRTISDEQFTADCADISQLIDMYGSAEIVLALRQATPEDSTEGFQIEASDNEWADLPPEEQANFIAVLNAAEAGNCP